MGKLEVVPQVQLTAWLEAIERAAADDRDLKTERHEAYLLGSWLSVDVHVDGEWVGTICYFARGGTSLNVRSAEPQVLVERAARLVEVFETLRAKAVL